MLGNLQIPNKTCLHKQEAEDPHRNTKNLLIHAIKHAQKIIVTRNVKDALTQEIPKIKNAQRGVYSLVQIAWNAGCSHLLAC